MAVFGMYSILGSNNGSFSIIYKLLPFYRLSTVWYPYSYGLVKILMIPIVDLSLKFRCLRMPKTNLFRPHFSCRDDYSLQIPIVPGQVSTDDSLAPKNLSGHYFKKCKLVNTTKP